MTCIHKPKDVVLHQHNNQLDLQGFDDEASLTSILQPEIPDSLVTHFDRVALWLQSKSK